MSFGHRIGLQLSRALVRSNAGISRRCVSVTAFKSENGGDCQPSCWHIFNDHVAILQLFWSRRFLIDLPCIGFGELRRWLMLRASVFFVFLIGKSDSGWKLYPIDPSEEVRQEPWLKSAMDTLNRELMRQGTRIRGQCLEWNCLLGVIRGESNFSSSSKFIARSMQILTLSAQAKHRYCTFFQGSNSRYIFLWFKSVGYDFFFLLVHFDTFFQGS